MNEQLTYERDYPDLHVGIDPQVLAENAISQVFGRLLALDMDQVREAIFGRSKPDSHSHFDIIVTTPDADEGGPILELSLHSTGFLDVHVDPAKFDRTKPKQEEVFQRCAALVKALHESTYSADDNYEHPRLDGFMFWCRNEDQTSEESAAAWAKVAEIWEAASK